MMATIRVLELLRQAASFYDLEVDSCFKSLGSTFDHAGDMGNALRFLAWSLQQVFTLRHASNPNDMMLLIFVEDAQLVTAWVSQQAAKHSKAAKRRKNKYEEQLQDLIGLGYCKEEIFGDSPLGDQMQTGRAAVDRAIKLSKVWDGFKGIAQELHGACGVLANVDSPIHKAVVDVESLPTYCGRPYPAFVADELMGGLEMYCCFGEHELTLIPSGQQRLEVQGKNVLLTGGILETITIDGFAVTDATPMIRIACKGRVTETAVRVEKTPKATYVWGWIEAQVPAVCIVCKDNTVRYGFCKPNNCRDLGRWISKDVFMALH